MRIGIFGSDKDPQCHAVAKALACLGVDNLLVRADALDEGLPISIVDQSLYYRGQCLDDIRGYYLRFIPAAYTPYMQRDRELVLYEDWYARYMHERERASFYVAWLLNLVHDGVTILNAPQAASVLQYKPFQLHALRALGARTPRTLISNDPARIRQFKADVGDVIYKPLMGGAITRLLDEEAMAHLDHVTNSPVIFQERAPGRDLRIMVVGDQIVSAVAIVTDSPHLDFRADPTYSSGNARYDEVSLPQPIEELCIGSARECGLTFAGIDIKHDGDDYVFLELNSSPIYLDVERKLGHGISDAIAAHLVARAHRNVPPAARRPPAASTSG